MRELFDSILLCNKSWRILRLRNMVTTSKTHVDTRARESSDTQASRMFGDENRHEHVQMSLRPQTHSLFVVHGELVEVLVGLNRRWDVLDRPAAALPPQRLFLLHDQTNIVQLSQ